MRARRISSNSRHRDRTECFHRLEILQEMTRRFCGSEEWEDM